MLGLGSRSISIARRQRTKLSNDSGSLTSKQLSKSELPANSLKTLGSSSRSLISAHNVRYFHATVMSHVKIYTKTGDRGTSSLFNGERRPKSDAVFEALGNVDELNASIGLCYEHAVLAAHNDLASQLTVIQSALLDLGSHIATPKTSEATDEKRLERAKFDSEPLIAMLESSIDEWDKELPALRNFILPSGGLCAAHCHVARAVCRRAERSIVTLLEQGDVDPEAFKYINRLSDYFFQAARFAAHREGKTEVAYKKPKTTAAPSESTPSL